MLIYAQISILSRYFFTILHRELADRNRCVEEELEDEEIPSPVSLFL